MIPIEEKCKLGHFLCKILLCQPSRLTSKIRTRKKVYHARIQRLTSTTEVVQYVGLQRRLSQAEENFLKKIGSTVSKDLDKADLYADSCLEAAALSYHIQYLWTQQFLRSAGAAFHRLVLNIHATLPALQTVRTDSLLVPFTELLMFTRQAAEGFRSDLLSAVHDKFCENSSILGLVSNISSRKIMFSTGYLLQIAKAHAEIDAITNLDQFGMVFQNSASFINALVMTEEQALGCSDFLQERIVDGSGFSDVGAVKSFKRVIPKLIIGDDNDWCVCTILVIFLQEESIALVAFERLSPILDIEGYTVVKDVVLSTSSGSVGQNTGAPLDLGTIEVDTSAPRSLVDMQEEYLSSRQPVPVISAVPQSLGTVTSISAPLTSRSHPTSKQSQEHFVTGIHSEEGAGISTTGTAVATSTSRYSGNILAFNKAVGAFLCQDPMYLPANDKKRRAEDTDDLLNKLRCNNLSKPFTPVLIGSSSREIPSGASEAGSYTSLTSKVQMSRYLQPPTPDDPFSAVLSTYLRTIPFDLIEVWIPVKIESTTLLLFGGCATTDSRLKGWSSYSRNFCFGEKVGIPGRVFVQHTAESTSDVSALSPDSFLRVEGAALYDIHASVGLPIFGKDGHSNEAVVVLYSKKIFQVSPELIAYMAKQLQTLDIKATVKSHHVDVPLNRRNVAC